MLNTPRTLGEILPVLMQRIIAALAASGSDQRTGASRCLGELVRKLAERVLPTIIPILQQGLSNPDANTRQVRHRAQARVRRRGTLTPRVARSLSTPQGICLGLSEVLTSATRVQLARFVRACGVVRLCSLRAR